MPQKKSNRHTTIQDIHRERRRMAEKFDGDIAAILEGARKRQETSGRPIWQAATSDKTTPPTLPADSGF